MRGLFLTVLSGLLLAAVPSAAADADGKGAPPVDVATLACRDFGQMAETDVKTYEAIGVWLDGWLNGQAGETGYSPAGMAARAQDWLRVCAQTPDRPLLDVATSSPLEAADDGFDMAFLKCYQFIDLAEQDRKAAVAAVRWNDGWHAGGGIGETHVSVKDHEKMTDGFLEGCAKAKYGRKNLIRVMGGKYR